MSDSELEEKFKLPKPPADDGKPKLDATGGLPSAIPTPYELQLLQAIREMGLKPDVHSSEAMRRLGQVLSGETDTIQAARPKISTTASASTTSTASTTAIATATVSTSSTASTTQSVTTSRPTVRQYPKFSIFYGEVSKGEVSWDSFRYEVNATIRDKVFTDAEVMFGLRRALKGSAADKIRHLGPDVTAVLALRKLEGAYGSIESKESVLRKFYTCEQQPGEAVETYAAKIEELFDKAVELEAFQRTNCKQLKEVFYSGLVKEIKHMAMYQRDRSQGYEEFKQEVRKIEADLKADKKPCRPTIPMEKKEESEVTILLKQLNDRMDRLEKKQVTEREVEETNMNYYRQEFPQQRWRGGYRGSVDRGMERGRGRGTYRPQRPLASGTFAPTCFLCNKKGHIQRNCPTITSQLVCSHCRNKGHVSMNCPN